MQTKKRRSFKTVGVKKKVEHAKKFHIWRTYHVTQSIEDFWAVIVSVSIKSRACVHILSTTHNDCIWDFLSKNYLSTKSKISETIKALALCQFQKLI